MILFHNFNIELYLCYWFSFCQPPYSSKRVLNENVIGIVKRFRVLAEKYRNRRKRFHLRFNLIAGIYNFELQSEG